MESTIVTHAPSVREIKSAIPQEARTRSSARGVLVFAFAFLFWLGAFAGVLLAPTWLIKFLSGGVLGLGIAVLFVLGHDACHGALTPNRRLNGWLGRIAFLPSLHPFVAWEYSHNVLHHGWTNLRGRDPVYVPFSKAEFDQLPRWRRTLERVYRSMLGVGLMYLVEVWWKLELFPAPNHRKKIDERGSFRLDRALVLAFAVLQIVAVLLLSKVPESSQAGAATMIGLIAVSVLWPFAAWNWLMGFFTYQHHTHPTVAWYANVDDWSFFDGQVRGTVHVEFPWLIEFVLNNIMQHTAHHVDPRIPLYNLKESQAELERKFADAMVVEHWTLRGYRDLFRICQLYDYEGRQWLDFDGRPTLARAEYRIP
jgi:omega-6 fatty acid desaturase (delta-12 desaturase)